MINQNHDKNWIIENHSWPYDAQENIPGYIMLI